MLHERYQSNSKLSLWERIGAGLSFACAIHCIATPLLIAFLPMASSTLAHSHEIEYILLSISFIIVGLTNLIGFLKHHKQYAPIVYMLLGFSLVLSGHATDQFILEILLSLVGGGFIAFSLFKNHQSKHQQSNCSCSH